MTTTMRLTALAAVAALTMTGCDATARLFGADDVAGPIMVDPPAPGRDLPLEPPGSDGPGIEDEQGQTAQVAEEHPGTTENTRPRPWESYTVEDDGVTVNLFFWSGVEPCYVVDHVEVVDEGESVSFTLFEGSQRVDGEQMACIEIAVYKVVQVTLDAPLADREVIDGAA